MTINQARTAIAVALALSSCVALADGFQFQKGFYIGANTGASFVTGQTYSQLVKPVNQFGPFRGTTQTIRDEASARGYNGGVTLGWDFYSDREYIYGIAVNGNAYSNRAFQTWWSQGESLDTHTDIDAAGKLQNFQESWDMKYSADLVLKPGWFISDSTEMYALLGGSIAEVNVELKNVWLNEPREDIRSFEQNKTIYGFVLGAGLQKQLCNRLSVFASYQYTYYGKTRLKRGLEDSDALGSGNESPTFITNRAIRIDTNVAKIGLLYTF